jgi:AraC-like DNA-binding protein
MLLHPTCEPIDLAIETAALVDHVVLGADAPPTAPFLHFHDVVEIILFEHANGEMICDGRHFAVQPGSAAIVPSMKYHDFALRSEARSWTLIQLDSYLVERIAVRTSVSIQPNCEKLTAQEQTRLFMLANWLDDSLKGDQDGDLVEEIIALLVTALGKVPVADGKPSADINTDIERFLPVIERLRAQPGRSFPLKEAASLCNLSPTYFSRRFAAIFGCGFADYVASYRLHLAARHVATTSIPFSTISYALGFASPSHFAERYRERFGMTPREYRRRVRKVG